MREKATVLFAMLILAVLIPYLGTIVLTGTVGTATETVEELNTGKTVTLNVDGQYEAIDAEAYLAGVLPGILGDEPEEEVWKALAIIERTNLYQSMEGLDRIDEADLDMDYLSEAERRALWGERQYETYEKKVEEAILETAGRTLQYDGEYIDALFHRASIGTTVSAEELLEEDIPYLTAVSSSHDVESKDYMNITTVSKDEVSELTILESTEHGYVKRVSWNGEEMTGEEFQEAFGLPSLNYYMEDLGDAYRIVCLGCGHGLGFSLYGASCMAQEGSGYAELLEYYYPGTALTE